MKKLNVALIGYGRSGCDIHGSFLKSKDNDICSVAAVVENDPARAEAARRDFGCDTCTSYTELLGRTDIDFVVNASYSDLHYPVTRDLLAHGFKVLCEKPLCKTPEMVQDMIDTAKAHGTEFTIFHQYRYNDSYIKMKELLDKGLIGQVKLVRNRQNSFNRRYDWQTLIYRDAGSMRNNAAHYIEEAMSLAGSDEMPKVDSHLAIWNAVGDAEDYVLVVLTYPDGTRYELEVNPSDAFGSEEPLYRIYGTRGTMQVYNDRIRVKYFLDSECPEPVLEHRSIHHEDGSPAYCSNHIVWHEETVALEADVWNTFGKCTARFYHDWYDHLVNGAALFMTPEHVKVEIAIMCEVERQNPLEQKFTKPDYVI